MASELLPANSRLHQELCNWHMETTPSTSYPSGDQLFEYIYHFCNLRQCHKMAVNNQHIKMDQNWENHALLPSKGEPKAINRRQNWQIHQSIKRFITTAPIIRRNIKDIPHIRAVPSSEPVITWKLQRGWGRERERERETKLGQIPRYNWSFKKHYIQKTQRCCCTEQVHKM